MMSNLDNSWLKKQPNMVFFGILFFRFFAMLGPVILQNSGWLVVCSLLGFFGYVLLAIAAIIYNKKQMLPLAFVACLPEFVYAFTADFGLVDWLVPVATILAIVFLARCLRVYQSWRFGIEYMLGASCLIVVLLHFFVGDLTQWWAQQLYPVMDSLNQQVDEAQKTQLLEVSKWLPKVQTGYTAFMWLVFFPMCIVHFSSLFLKTMDSNILSKYKSGIVFGKIITCIGIMFLVMSFLFNVDVLFDIMPIWIVGFILVGLSFIHEIANKQTMKHMILIAIYISILLMAQVFLPLILILGCLDCLFDLRMKVLSK